MRGSIHTRVEQSTRDRVNRLALSQSPHRRASKWPPSPSPRASFCGPAVQEEGRQSSPAALHNHDLCPLLPLLSHEQCLLRRYPLQRNHDPCLPLCLLRPHRNQDLYRNPLQRSMAQQTTRDRRQRHECPLHLHLHPPHQPRQRNLPSEPSTTSPASQLVN